MKNDWSADELHQALRILFGWQKREEKSSDSQASFRLLAVNCGIAAIQKWLREMEGNND